MNTKALPLSDYDINITRLYNIYKRYDPHWHLCQYFYRPILPWIKLYNELIQKYDHYKNEMNFIRAVGNKQMSTMYLKYQYVFHKEKTSLLISHTFLCN